MTATDEVTRTLEDNGTVQHLTQDQAAQLVRLGLVARGDDGILHPVVGTSWEEIQKVLLSA